MSYTLMGVLGLLAWYFFVPNKPAVPTPPPLPLEVGAPPVAIAASKPRHHGFVVLIELQDALVAQGYSAAEVDAVLAKIPAMLLSKKEPTP